MLPEAVDTDAYHDGAAQLAGTCNVLVWVMEMMLER
jgi:hypothetical protein